MSETLAGAYNYYEGTGANDGDVLFTSAEESFHDGVMLHSSAGSVKVEVQIKVGGSWIASVALQDLTSVSTTPVLTTTAGHIYGIVGNYHALRVKQNGAPAATAIMRTWKKSNG